MVEIESEIERERREQQEHLEQQVIEVAPTVPDEVRTASRVESGASKEKLDMVEALQSQAAQKSWGVEHPDPLVKSKVPVTRAERRRLIKQEIQRLSQANEPVYYQRRLW